MDSQAFLTQQQFALFKKGDRNAFKDVYDRYFSLVRYVTQRCGLNDEESMDVVQESFLKLYKNASTIETPQGLKRWLLITARNQSFDYIRKQKLDQRGLGDLHGELDMIEAQNNTTEPFLIPAALLRELEVKLLGELLSTFEKDTKDDTLSLYYTQGLSVKTIAQAKGEPVSSVTNRLSRGRKKLRERIKDHIQALHDNAF